MVITKKEFIQSNQYLRKWFKNLKDDDLIFFQEVVEWKINPHSKDSILLFKQVIYHMQSNMTLWECRGLLKAFKTLQILPD